MLWLKALHIISFVTWFAGLFYLPRLFVYHSMTSDAISSEQFKTMERKLYRGIMMPGMIMTIIFGGWLLLQYDRMFLSILWFQMKLALVATLIIYHFYCGHLIKVFKNDNNRYSHIFYRWLNEYPTIVLIAVVILAMVQPF
jgi:putative membrane protein